MKQFGYVHSDSFAAASKALASNGDALAKGAGTDLLDLLKERVLEPAEIVNLLRIKREEGKGELSALATLAEVAEDEWIRAEFPALHKAAGEAATPQIRNVGTVGGNLCQSTRCWFLRQKGFECFKLGAGNCAAMAEGAANRHHAIFPHRRCACAHPSNLAPALIALKARLACVHPDGDRILDAELLYEQPKSGKISDTVLRQGELIRAVLLEPSPLAKRSTYLEFRERLSFDFAVASVAVALDMQGGTVKEARIVCGGVAPTPYRATKAESALTGRKPDPAAAAAAAVEGAEPLAQNRHKVVILKRLVQRALEEVIA